MTYTHLTNFTQDSPDLVSEITRIFSENPEYSSIEVVRPNAFRFEVRKFDYEILQQLRLSELRVAYLYFLSSRSIILQQENPEFWRVFFMSILCPVECTDLDNYLISLAKKCSITLPK